MKYIVTLDKDDNEEMFVFPRTINHDRFAEVLLYLRIGPNHDWRRAYRHPIAAGFVDSKGNCYGKSETLNLNSRPQDTNLLRLHHTQ